MRKLVVLNISYQRSIIQIQLTSFTLIYQPFYYPTIKHRPPVLTERVFSFTTPRWQVWVWVDKENEFL